jgi:hypothetical protein
MSFVEEHFLKLVDLTLKEEQSESGSLFVVEKIENVDPGFLGFLIYAAYPPVIIPKKRKLSEGEVRENRVKEELEDSSSRFQSFLSEKKFVAAKDRETMAKKKAAWALRVILLDTPEVKNVLEDSIKKTRAIKLAEEIVEQALYTNPSCAERDLSKCACAMGLSPREQKSVWTRASTRMYKEMVERGRRGLNI